MNERDMCAFKEKYFRNLLNNYSLINRVFVFIFSFYYLNLYLLNSTYKAMKCNIWISNNLYI